MKSPLFQTILSAATGVAALLASATLATGASQEEVAVPVAYTVPSDVFLSLALFNDHGQLVRSLLSAKPVKAGSGSVTWDGTSDLGIPQRAGRYSTKAIFFKEKPKAEYVMTVGKSGNPPYRTGRASARVVLSIATGVPNSCPTPGARSPLLLPRNEHAIPEDGRERTSRPSLCCHPLPCSV